MTPNNERGYSFKNFLYNGVSSVLGGFGGFNNGNSGLTEVSSNSSYSETPQSSASPLNVSQNQGKARPKHSRFNRSKERQKD